MPEFMHKKTFSHKISGAIHTFKKNEIIRWMKIELYKPDEIKVSLSLHLNS